jgi:hypothetical protein
VSARPFVTAEQFDLVNLQNQASAALRQITRNASTCTDNIKNCQFPDVAIPAIVLPQRKDGTPDSRHGRYGPTTRDHGRRGFVDRTGNRQLYA